MVREVKHVCNHFGKRVGIEGLLHVCFTDGLSVRDRSGNPASRNERGIEADSPPGRPKELKLKTILKTKDNPTGNKQRLIGEAQESGTSQGKKKTL